MLIQNSSSATQAQQPARLAGDGGPVAVVAPTIPQAPPAVAVVLPQTAVSPVAEPPQSAQLQGAVDNLNQALKQSNKNLEFTVDSESKDPIVKLVDSETGDVIRQYPSEEAISIAKAIDSFQQGMLIKQEA